jgi:hypothetical protein
VSTTGDRLATIDAIRDELHAMAGPGGHWLDVIQKGVDPRRSHAITYERCMALYRMARELCDEGNFKDALPLALYLSMVSGQDPRFMFLAGTCLQRMGEPLSAVPMYSMSVMADPNNIAALFRMGESMEQAGAPREEVLPIFEQVFEAARGEERLRGLQRLAEQGIDRLGVAA